MDARLASAPVRALLKLREQRIEGADEALERMLYLHRDELVAGLGRPLNGEAPHEVLRDWLELGRRGAKRRAEANELAQHYALLLGEHAIVHRSKVLLRPEFLREAARSCVHPWLAFRRGRATRVVDVRLLRSMLAKMQKGRIEELSLGRQYLHITFSARGTQGRYRLALRPYDKRDSALTVNLVGKPVGVPAKAG